MLTTLVLQLACRKPDEVPEDSDSEPVVPSETGTVPEAPETAQTGDTGDEPTIPGPCGVLQSVELVGGPEYDSTQNLAVAADGALYVGGFFLGPLVFDAGGPAEAALVPTGDLDGFVARYAADGSFAWVRQLATTQNAAPDEVAVTSDGGVVVLGAFYGDVTIAAGEPDAVTLTSTGEADGFVARFDDAGGLSWAVQFGSPAADAAVGLGILADDSVMFVGHYHGDATFGAGEAGETLLALHPSAHLSGFVAELRPDGTLLWADRFGGTESALATGAVLDPVTQELVVSGSFGGPGAAEFPGNPPIVIDPVEFAGFVSRWNADGETQWVATFTAYPAAVDLAGDGSELVVGDFFGSAVFGAGEPTESELGTNAQTDMFTARFDPAGGLLWAAQSVSTNQAVTTGRAVAASADGGAVVTGDTIQGGIQLGSGEPTETSFASVGSYDAFVARFDSAGALRCAVQIGAPGLEIGANVVLRADGRWTTTGDLEQTVTFAPGTPEETVVESSGSFDGYLATWLF